MTTLTRFLVESGDLHMEIEAVSAHGAADMALFLAEPGTRLGQMVSVTDMDEDDPWYFPTLPILERLGIIYKPNRLLRAAIQYFGSQPAY